MRKLIFLFVIFCSLSADWVEYSYFQKVDTQAKERATYLYGFTKYFEWPNKEGNFIITVIGDNAGLISELTTLAKTKMVGAQKIEIQNFQTLKEAEKPNIVFITPDKSNLLADAVSKYKGKGTLIITEKAGLAKIGAVINFIVHENRTKFELNKTAASKAGLTLGSSLEKLALNVFN